MRSIQLVFIIQLNSDDLGEVQEALWEAQLEWYNIGLRLNMKSHELDRIGTEAGDDTGKKLTQMIKSRLKMTEPCTWRVIYEALKNPTVNMPHVAQKLLQKKKIVIPTGEYQCSVYLTLGTCTGGLQYLVCVCVCLFGRFLPLHPIKRDTIRISALWERFF